MDEDQTQVPEEQEPPSPKRKPRRLALVITAVVFAAALTGCGVWWLGVGLPAQEAASAQAAEHEKTEAGAKKKAEDSAAFWAKVDAENKVLAAKDAAAAAKFDASYEADRATEAAASIKKQMEDQGWTQFAGDFYYQYADKSEYTCGYSSCLYVHVTTMAPNGCPGGLYVAATIDSGSSSVGKANSITAALPQGKDAIVKLEDHSGAGEKMGLTDVHCLRG